MKKINLILTVHTSVLLAALLCIAACTNAQVKKQPDDGEDCALCGYWVWEENNINNQFSLQINSEDSLLVGRHCYVLNGGSKMDCSMSEEDITFTSEDSTSTELKVEVTSFYSGSTGLVRLKLIDNRLYWKILEEPKTEYYFPDEAILRKP